MPFSDLMDVTNSPNVINKALAMQMLQENANRLNSAQHPFIQTDFTILEDNELGDCSCDSYMLLDVTRQIPLVIYQGDNPVVAVASCIFNMFADAVYDLGEEQYTSVKVDAEILVGSEYLSDQSVHDEIMQIDYKINGVIQDDQEIIDLMKNLLFTIDDRDYIDDLLEKRLVESQLGHAYLVEAIHKINGLQYSHFYKMTSPYPLKSEDPHIYKSLAYSGLYGVSQDFCDNFDSEKQQYTKPFHELKLDTSTMVDWDDGFSLVRVLVQPFEAEHREQFDLMEHNLIPSEAQDRYDKAYGYGE